MIIFESVIEITVLPRVSIIMTVSTPNTSFHQNGAGYHASHSSQSSTASHFSAYGQNLGPQPTGHYSNLQLEPVVQTPHGIGRLVRSDLGNGLVKVQLKSFQVQLPMKKCEFLATENGHVSSSVDFWGEQVTNSCAKRSMDAMDEAQIGSAKRRLFG